MTDQVTDSDRGQQDETTPPVPSFASEVPAGAPASTQGSNEDALIEKVLQRLDLDGRIGKALKSTTDKRLSVIDKLGGVDQLMALQDYIKASGGDVAKGMREFQIDQMLAGNGQNTPSQAVPGRDDAADTNKQMASWAADVLTTANVPFTDPDYLAVSAKQYATPAQFQTEVTKMIARKHKQLTPVTASSVADAGGAHANNASADDKRTKATNRLNELNKTPGTSVAEIAAAKAELKALMQS